MRAPSLDRLGLPAFGYGPFRIFFAANLLANVGLAQEVTVNYAAGTSEQALAGVQTNVIPRDGGNTFKATLFASFTNESLQGTNYTQDLQDRGLRTPNRIKETYDINPAVGGPLMRDRVWFYASGRWVKNANYVGGCPKGGRGAPAARGAWAESHNGSSVNRRQS